jgi:CubicO group peptidase (beta-lactamase class C family)
VISGEVATGFEPVAEAFEENFETRREVGAAFAAYVDGRPVVDLWGGLADPRTGVPWQRDTMAMAFSGTKGWVGTCILLLLERGSLRLEDPVALHWPEFGANGKEAILVTHVLGHLAGLPGVRAPLTIADLPDHRRIAALLEGDQPFWRAGSRVAYHPLTYGWICGELVRRIDGRSIGRFFAEEVAEPLQLDAWIGVPAEELSRVAPLALGAEWVGRPRTSDEGPVTRWVYDNPPGRFDEPLPLNTPAYLSAEFPATNGVATARALARLYGCLAQGGELDGTRVLDARTVRLGRHCVGRGNDALTGRPVAFGVGFGLQTRRLAYGPPVSAFGAEGTGGTVGAAWPDTRAGFGYMTNELRNADTPDPRVHALLGALHLCVQRGSTAPEPAATLAEPVSEAAGSDGG